MTRFLLICDQGEMRRWLFVPRCHDRAGAIARRVARDWYGVDPQTARVRRADDSRDGEP